LRSVLWRLRKARDELLNTIAASRFTAAIKDISEVLQAPGASPNGLDETKAVARLEKYGPNEVAQESKHEWLYRLWVAVRNPLVILLTVPATFSYATGDFRAGTVTLRKDAQPAASSMPMMVKSALPSKRLFTYTNGLARLHWEF
jgi:magnesium-transporting ATPase (P-type)